ncbi:ABC transporter permease [Brumicola nitratireducens]|uniref:ABC-type Na+ efflux pump, permease component n=1 Tax=Glaciecola nitratireducens (strain JCM 12485 / KCTC 12276 / FR1064) TaxID=1085623 RepID=G4QIW0_GLANF|nr:ABC transporter permease [Glaciecola nitratireducens]AEP28299.1 ABC-type Na+ efflux pump, permease component [Glaciecola nitratireducens FR1064]
MKSNKSRQLWLVTSWEFIQFFKWKQELVSKLIMLAIGAMVLVWQYVQDDSEPSYRIAVTQNNGKELADGDAVPTDLPAKIAQFEFVQSSVSASSLATTLSEESAYDAVLLYSLDSNGQRKLTVYSQEKQAWLAQLQQALLQHYSIVYAEQLGLQAEQLSLLTTPAVFVVNFMDDSIREDDGVSSATAIGMIVLLAIGVFTSFGQLFAGVTGEKQQRVTEQLYSCISAQTWVDGKICGQILHGMKAMVSSAITGLLIFAFVTVIVKGQALDFSFLNWALVPWLLLFALAGLYLCTAFMAAIAAAIDDPNHSAKTSMMLLPLVPIILTFLSMDNPSGWALTFLSYFPLTAFAAMPVKMSLIDVPFWQPLISFGLMVVLCLWVRGAAGRLFKMGMVMYGKEPTLKDMLRWVIKSEN